MFGVYWDIFYHHAAGSRSLGFRGTSYYPTIDAEKLNKKILLRIEEDSDFLIHELTKDSRIKLL
jgi:hypothetical protein